MNLAISASLTSLSPFISSASFSFSSIFFSSSSFRVFSWSYVDWLQPGRSSLMRRYRGASEFVSISLSRWSRAVLYAGEEGDWERRVKRCWARERWGIFGGGESEDMLAGCVEPLRCGWTTTLLIACSSHLTHLLRVWPCRTTPSQAFLENFASNTRQQLDLGVEYW